MTNKKDTQKIVKHPVRGRGRDCDKQKIVKHPVRGRDRDCDKQKVHTEDREVPCEG